MVHVDPLRILVIGNPPVGAPGSISSGDLHLTRCASQAEALSRLAADVPDLVVVDTRGGPEFTPAAAVGLRHGLPMLPVVVVADGPESALLAALAAGADEVIGPASLGDGVALRAIAGRAGARRAAAAEAVQPGQPTPAERLRESARLEVLGQVAGSIVHDFNNVLSAAVLASGMLLDELPPGSLGHECARELRASVGVGVGLARQLLDVIRHRADAGTADIDATIHDLSPLLQSAFGRQYGFRCELGAGATRITLGRSKLSQLLLNLVVNARDAVGENGRLVIRTFTEDSAVVLEVEDNGCGMSPDVLSHAFEPFYSTKAASRGTGLGLASVKGLVDQAGGRVDVRTSPGAGTSFIVHLPAVSEPAA